MVENLVKITGTIGITKESDLIANSTWEDEEEADLITSKLALVLDDEYSGSSK